MSRAVSRKDFIIRVADKMGCDEETATLWLDGITGTLYETFKERRGVSLTGFGSFYCDQRRESTAFKFNPSQKLRKLLGWSSTYKGEI
ncbi:Histone family protein DNA-binding protein [Desulfamplus magnetovallimortis]|uniref:Histone family protein DNA-binding protein n=1 Tax=Desulfamplus magnetovallimortis TaxID=1246637 RepID=A0A1W1HBC1_9BACT|nr:HU family DNA-binding protein [Desulfamplus magnetovallimortis]SLM29794.1 Histone family protein DNA-binding protein [Desulfamplus magnetovallimortis]